jgi:hypothetical protein
VSLRRVGFNSGVEGDFVNAEVTEIYLRNTGMQEIKNSRNFDLGQNQNKEIGHLQERILESGLSHRFGLVHKPISSVFNAFHPCKSVLSVVKKLPLNAFHFQFSILHFQLTPRSLLW